MAPSLGAVQVICLIVLWPALQELDFVLANVMMALIADFMLVWLPAPTLSYKYDSVCSSCSLRQLDKYLHRD